MTLKNDIKYLVNYFNLRLAKNIKTFIFALAKAKFLLSSVG